MTRAVCFVVLSACLLGCGGGSTEPPNPTAASVTAEGWTAFEAGLFDEADALFLQALDLTPGFTDALTGRGWVAVETGNPANSLLRFAEALAQAATYPDALAGRILAAAALDLPASIVEDGGALIALDPAYSFSHVPLLRPPYTASVIRWLLARAGLDLGDFLLVEQQLNVLAPGHGLNPASVTFAQDALALLESLRSSI